MAPSQAVVEGVSGGIGSCVATLSTYPLKTIYTLQAVAAKGSEGGAALSVLDVIQRYKLAGLYAGIGPNLFESALSSAVYFYFYSKLRELVLSSSSSAASPSAKPHQDIGVLQSLLVATAAGACNQLITLPASTVATRMQVQQSGGGQPSSSWGVVKEIVRADGVFGLWKGLAPSLVLLANPAMQYMLYEQILRLMRRWKALRIAAQAAAARSRLAALAPDANSNAVQAARATLAQQQAAGANSRAAPKALAQQRHGSSASSVRRRTVDSDDLVDGGSVDTAASPSPKAAGREEDDSATTAAACGPGPGSAADLASPFTHSHSANALYGAVPDPGAAAEAAAAVPAAVVEEERPVRLSAGEVFLASALAKIAATVVTYPLIVIKSRLQAAGKPGPDGKPLYNGAWDACVKTARQEGIGGFFNGLQAKILQTALNAALMLMIKEQLSSGTKALLQGGAVGQQQKQQAARKQGPSQQRQATATAASGSRVAAAAAAVAAAARVLVK